MPDTFPLKPYDYIEVEAYTYPDEVYLLGFDFVLGDATLGSPPDPTRDIFNLAPNPSFENNNAGWSVFPSDAGSVLSLSGGAGQAAYGEFALRSTSTSANSRMRVTTADIPVEPSTAYAVSMSVRPNSVTAQYNLSVNYYNSLGNIVGGIGLVANCTAGAYTRINRSISTPASAVAIRVNVGLLSDPTNPLGTSTNYDGLLVTKSATSPVEYFDGDTPDRDGYDFVWEGTPGNSVTRGISPSVKSWRRLTCETRGLNIRRGGTASGVGNTIDVGVMSASLIGLDEPWAEQRLAPGTPIRVRGGGVELFQGRVEDLQATFLDDGTSVSTVVATDFVRQLQDAAGRDYVSPFSHFGRRPYENARAVALASGAVVTTLTSGSTRQGLNYATLPVPATGSWTRYGSNPVNATPLALALVGSYLQVNDAFISPGIEVDLTGLERGVTTSISGLTPGNSYTGIIYLAPQTTFNTAVVPPDSLGYRIGVETSTGTQWTPVQYINGSGAGFQRYVVLSFRAESDSHVIKISRDYTGKVGGADSPTQYRPESYQFFFANLREVSGPEDYHIQVNSYDTSRANRLDLITRSGDFTWYIRPGNGSPDAVPGGAIVINDNQVMRPVQANMSDVHDEGDPLHLCYRGIELSYETGKVVNELRVENRGSLQVRDSITDYITNDTMGTYVDANSVERFGVRSANTDLSLGQFDVTRRVTEILEDASEPVMLAQSVTVNPMLGTPELVLTLSLDIDSPVNVKRKTLNARHKVVGITHNITPYKWTTTFDLRKD